MPSETAREAAQDALKRYDETMAEINLHAIMALMDDFIRFANKHWTSGIACATNENNDEARRQVLCDSFYLLRVVCLLMHPIVPVGTELICDHLDFDPEDFFSWNYDFESNEELCSATEIDQGFKRIRPIPPKFDFFPKHSSQR